jgi:uncharacterized tellurite resistance protein B-like protein
VARVKKELSTEDRAELLRARVAVRKADVAYRRLARRMVRKYDSQAAVARALGVSPQALSEMLKRR